MSRKYNVGIYTWAISRNYGTCLQAYALQKYIDSLGNNACIFIPFIKSDSFILNFGRTIKRIADRGLYKYKKKNYAKLNENYSRFINNFDKLYYCLSPNDFDGIKVFLTGSDQLWNPNHLDKGVSFLEFGGNRPRFAYSTSIGVDDIPNELRDKYKRNIGRFQNIGMREELAVTVIKNILKDDCERINVQKVLDPTFLLRKADWMTIADNANIQQAIPDEYLFCYLLGDNEEYSKMLKLVWEQSGVKNLVIVQSAENSCFKVHGAISYNDVGPMEFVKLLLGAKIIITDSFHCSAISINNNKDFWEFLRFDDNDSASQNSRIYELLDDFGLRDRLIRNYESALNMMKEAGAISKSIDYNNVNNLLEKNRKESEDFLENALSRAIRSYESGKS